MGTRADFYVGRGPDAEWIGSIAWDAYPEGIDDPIMTASTEQEFRNAVAAFFDGRDDVTLPERGWPWPWDDSGTTDYAYAFDGSVWISCFGRSWFRRGADEPDGAHVVEFPDMSNRRNVRYDKGSGLVVFGGGTIA